jgi:lysophospholipase L1-like esterase
MRTIVCYGDSNTWGFDPLTCGRFPRDVRWPGVLRAGLGGEFEVIEEGLNGRTTVWDEPFEAGRNGASYLEPCLRSHAPIDLVVLMLGTNDLKAIYDIGPNEIATGAGSLVARIRRSGAGPDGASPLVLLVAPPAVATDTAHSALWGFEGTSDKSRRLAPAYRTAAEIQGCAMLDAASVTEASPIDGVHLDADGHAQLGRAIAAEVRRLFGAG